MLHELPIKDCPIIRTDSYIRSVLNGYNEGIYEGDLFAGLWEFSSDAEAWEAAKEGIGQIEDDTLIHGDYCLPNIILDNWVFSGYIDLIKGGISDRHIDILWGIWINCVV